MMAYERKSEKAYCDRDAGKRRRASEGSLNEELEGMLALISVCSGRYAPLRLTLFAFVLVWSGMRGGLKGRGGVGNSNVTCKFKPERRWIFPFHAGFRGVLLRFGMFSWLWFFHWIFSLGFTIGTHFLQDGVPTYLYCNRTNQYGHCISNMLNTQWPYWLVLLAKTGVETAPTQRCTMYTVHM